MYREKIDAYIDAKREEMLEDLACLVRIDSQKGTPKDGKPFGEGPAKVLQEAETLMKKCGLSTRNYENYVITGDFSDQEKELDILAHLDVVPVTQDWTVTQPFETKIVGGKIYGRGTADDKGPAIAALYALRAIKELGIPMKKSVRLILGSDEECGSSDLEYYYNIEREAPYSFTPDCDFPVINVEKGRLEGKFSADFTDGLQLPGVITLQSGDKINVVPQRARFEIAGLEEHVLQETAKRVSEETGVTFDICVKEMPEQNETLLKDGYTGISLPSGAKVYCVEARGQAAHAASPAEGKNALTASLYLIAELPLAQSQGQKALQALAKLLPWHDTSGKTLGIYREEEQSGAVTICFSLMDYTANHMSGAFDGRLPIGCTEENTKIPVKEAFGAHGIKLADSPMVKPHCVPGDSDFVQILLGSYERYTGIKGEPLSTGGGTYVHELERGVGFGCGIPGVDNHMHGDNEFMVIDTLLMSAKIFADAIVRICNELD